MVHTTTIMRGVIDDVPDRVVRNEIEYWKNSMRDEGYLCKVI